MRHSHLSQTPPGECLAWLAQNDRMQRSSPPSPKALADRSKLDAVEAALRALDEVRARQDADYQEEADALQRKRDAAHAAHICQREKILNKIAIERRAYQKAGGIS